MLTLVLKCFKFMNYLKRLSIVGFGQTWPPHIPIGCQLIFPIRQQKQPYKCFITPAKQLKLVFLLPFLHRIWRVSHKQDRCSDTRRQGWFCTPFGFVFYQSERIDATLAWCFRVVCVCLFSLKMCFSPQDRKKKLKHWCFKNFFFFSGPRTLWRASWPNACEGKCT